MDPREARLPVWARELIGKLRREAKDREYEVRTFVMENDRLRDLLAGKYAQKSETADTFFLNEVTDDEIPLGTGPEIRFGDYFTVKLEGNYLSLTSDGPMAIKPTNWDQEVFITQS